MLAKPLASALALGLLLALTPLGVDSASATDSSNERSTLPWVTAGGNDDSEPDDSGEDHNSGQLTEAQKRAAELKKKADEKAAEAAKVAAEANREAVRRATQEQLAAAIASRQANEAAIIASNTAKKLALEAARKKVKAAKSRVEGNETEDAQDEADAAANAAEVAKQQAQRAANRAETFAQLASDKKHTEIETKYGRISSFSLPPLVIKQSSSANLTSMSVGNRVVIPGSITPDPAPTEDVGSTVAGKPSKTGFMVSSLDVGKRQVSADSSTDNSASTANELYEINPRAASAVVVSSIKISSATPADEFIQAAYWSLAALAIATGSLLLGAGVSSLRSRRQD
jgi:hypothetical protein